MTELVTLVCFALLISPALVYYTIRRKHRLARDRVLERRLGDSSATPRAQPAWTPPKDEMTLVLARLRMVPWVGSYLSQTMRQATVPLVLAIPALLVAGTVISGHWLKVPGALLLRRCRRHAARTLRAAQGQATAQAAQRTIAVSD